MEEKRERMGLTDQIILACRRKDGSVKWRVDTAEEKRGNSITNAGMAEVAGLILTDVGGVAFDYIAIGTGTTAPAATDTALELEIARKAGTGTRVTTAVTNDTAQIVATFSSADGLTGTHNVSEAGVFNAATGGVMLFRQTFTAKSVDWDAGDTLEVTAKCQMKQGV